MGWARWGLQAPWGLFNWQESSNTGHLDFRTHYFKTIDGTKIVVFFFLSTLM